MVRIRMHGQGFRKNCFSDEGGSPYSLFHFSEIHIPDLSDLLWVREDATYFCYPKLILSQQLTHGVFTRLGGMSDPPYGSLNTSYSVGDRPESVTANLSKIKEAIRANHLIFMNQSHGADIHIVNKDDFEVQSNVPLADAIITDTPGVALMVKQADCQGVIIFDPKNAVVANVHCGWRSNVKNILRHTVTRMRKVFGCRETDLLAAIGPSLGPCCAEFVSHKEIFPKEFERFMVRKNYFDLWAISYWQLLEAGLSKENIELAGICTRCRTDLFYSYRGEGKTGRFATVAMVKKGSDIHI